MGFFDFIKKFIGEEKEIEKERLAFSDINNWVVEKRKELDSENMKFLDLMDERIDKFREDVSENIEILEGINVNSIKTEEKIKLVVRDNLVKYIEYVKRFKKDLANLEKDSAVKIVKDFENLFSNFKKKSSLHFQKSTILIGKELGSINDCIGGFIKDIDDIIKNHKNCFEKTQTLERIEKKLKEKENVLKVKSEINKSIIDKEENIKEIEEEIGKINKKIIEIKNTAEYKEKDKEKAEIDEIRRNLSTEISNLRDMINFKELSNFFHISGESMAVVKAHKDNFREAFEKDLGIEIVKLLEESKLIKEGVKDKAGKIIEMKKRIEGFVYENREINNLEKELEEKNKYIENLDKEMKKEEKRIKGFEEDINEFNDLVKNNLEKIGVEIII